MTSREVGYSTAEPQTETREGLEPKVSLRSAKPLVQIY